jgi:N-acetyl-1-D-myo-inositol-2-amino-2-deoxy-alpha-D-glucopyranoside deacetylase
VTTPTLLCVHPHPDDESIACGGVLARAAEEGIRTVVVTCTGGEEGDNLAGIDLGAEELVVHRRRELAEALAALGVHAHHWLGYRDSGMVGTPGNEHPASFHRAEVDDAARRLAAIVRAERPHVVVSDDRNGTYGHPDHVKAYAVTVRAVELAAEPDAEVAGAPWQVTKRYVHTYARSRLLAGHQAMVAAGLPSPFGAADIELDAIPFGVPDEEVTTTVDVSGQLERKRAALQAHRSQIGEDSLFLNVPEQLRETFFGSEQFALEAGRPDADHETDLFAGIVATGGEAV